jgi:hypothetical protein
MIMNISCSEIIHNSDWVRVQRAAEIIQEQISQGKWDHKKSHDDMMKSAIYSMGSHGVATISSASDKSRWFFWNGAWLEKILTWAGPMRERFAQHGLPITNITYHNHTFSAPAHRDIAYLGEHFDLPHTNINYIISSEFPDSSYTYCRDDQGSEMRYYSHPGRMWLINASNVHGIESRGFRSALIIKFRLPYDQLAEFFTTYPRFFDEN